jgi:hypothetical protein
MFGSVILDVAIGMVLVFLLMSLLCSSLREALEGWLKTRSVHLERGIRELLHDPSGTGLVSDIYNHPLVLSLFRGGYDPGKIAKKTKKDGTVAYGNVPARGNLPSYIPSGNFALALLDVVARGPSGADPGAADADAPVLDLSTVRARIGEIQNAPVQRALLAAIDTAAGDLTRAQKNVEAWFDSSMDRVSGWYKRRTQLVLLVIGLVSAVAMNVDSLSIAQFLYTDKPARDALVAQAAAVAQDSDFVTRPRSAAQVRASIDSLALPIGWTRGEVGGRYWLVPAGRGIPSVQSWKTWWLEILDSLPGWLVTAFAVSFGAPFWFDVLNKFMVVRSTVKPHEKSPEEASEDRQTKSSPPPPHLGGGGGGAPPPPPQSPPGGGGGGGQPGGGQAPQPPPPPPPDPNDPGSDYQANQWATGNPEEGTL